MKKITAEEEQIIISEKIKEKISLVEFFTKGYDNSHIKDHFIFTLQRAYFKCAHECFESFDQRRRQEVISNWNRRHEDKSSFDWKRRHKEISSIDRLERQKEISTCIKHCNVPFVNARQKVEKDMAMFQERVNRDLKVCQDKYENAKKQLDISTAFMNLDSCLEHSTRKSIDAFPDFVKGLKATLNSDL